MTVELAELSLPGCTLIRAPIYRDSRGILRKPFQRSVFQDLNLPVSFAEQFFTVSHRGVVRGLHIQLPPSEQWKLVTCLTGSIFDVMLDVRVGSPAYGNHASVVLSGDDPVSLLLAPGIAHGFLAHSADALVGYSVTAEHDSARDVGVRWDSAGIPWPLEGPVVVSERDAALPALEDFVSPFFWEPVA